MKLNLVFLAITAVLSGTGHAQLLGKSEAVKSLESGHAELKQGQADLRREQTALNAEVRMVRESLNKTLGVIDNGPTWLTEPPEIANTVVVAVQGTKSTDRGRALEKAIHKGYAALSIKINSEVETLTKNYEFETGDSTVSEYQSFTRTVSKGQLEGVQRLKTEIVREGNQWYAMVLLAYPMDEKNTLRKLREQTAARREATARSQRAEQELDQTIRRRAEQERIQQDRLRQELGPVSSVAQPETVSTNQGTVQLLDVDNEEYKRRRAETLSKPNAVIGQITVQ